MIVCAWNVRGCNSPLKLKEVSDLLRSRRIDVMGILETRIHELNSSRLIRSFFGGLAVFCSYNDQRKGRIWLVWNPRTVSVLPMSSCSQLVHCHVLHHDTQSSFHCTFVYANNDPSVRLELWDNLCSLSSTVQEWLVLGDFNVIRDISERLSSSPPNLDDILVFNNCLLHCGLMDLQSSGCEFTWTNKQDGAARVWSKLDRAMVNNLWLAKFSSTFANFLPAGVSDHSPTLVTVLAEDLHPHRFSFLNCWSSMPGYHTLVQDCWGKHVTGSAISKLLARLRNVRDGLRSFHKANTLGLHRRLNQAKANLDSCSFSLQTNPSCPILLQNHQVAFSSYLKLKQAEISMLAQRAKADKIINNDSNSHVFHARIKERYHTQVIGDIVDHNGVHRSGSAQVVEGFLSFYQHLLGTSVAVHDLDSYISEAPFVNPSDWSGLTGEVQVEEVKSALFSIDVNSSPGFDGFSSGFFISSWHLIGIDLCSAIKEFFRTVRMPKQLNTTLLTLVPKKKVVKNVQDFRPIACCSVIYKVISKILANRMQLLLPLLIGQEQAAFIKGGIFLTMCFFLNT
ncbi:hypothetical protein RND81_13G009700 [Saponaria officinalis]|uniref:Endonuclease/exonuclease/phosphatase domain-containing protein n=1 Tax=Saponaria officinalis TaxID=3572 RepID=A0AAW1GVI3_SAPOF